MTALPHFLDYDPDDIDVRVAEMIVATHDTADPLAHPGVADALGILRRHLKMDVVFVSQLQDGRRSFKVVDSAAHVTRVVAGQSDPAEETWCKHVVEGRMPQFLRDAKPQVEAGVLPDPGMDIGTYMSTPITLKNGEVYGTLCCLSQDVVDGVSELDLRRLQIAAQLLAEDLHKSGVGAELTLEPKDGLAPRR
ncbi:MULTISPECIES: GAF domain-containing protein [Ramlibacter]|uniref:GAF domain-containing protein n=1 Tax=Ramlibacter aquaticus TaxID=2780094 RepID=A0ABR9SCD0_9BURK|nr:MULTISPECIES: GAF domain-containing protein [Ramlibacter]MBE7939514.1 GAF domain-containing protein [Ramlibacter aquaticus]